MKFNSTLSKFLLSLSTLVVCNSAQSSYLYNDSWQPQTTETSTQHKSLFTSSPTYNYKRNKINLSLDGGGIRGYISAIMLAYMEGQMEIQLGMPVKIGQALDMIAGTSTGALSALFLTVPEFKGSQIPKYSARDLVSLYEQHGIHIFTASWWHTITSVGGVLSPKFDDTNLDNLASQVFGDNKVKDATAHVFVTAFEITNDARGSKPVIFRSYDLDNLKSSDYLMRQAATASAAAPTYFAPEGIYDEQQSDKIYYIDGGMAMNNPDQRLSEESHLLIALKEKDLPNHKKTRSEDILNLSVGTGFFPLKCDPQLFSTGKLYKMVAPIIEIALSGPSQCNEEIMDLRARVMGNNNYIRLNPLLPYEVKLDDASPDTMKLMKDLALQYVEDNKKDLDNLINRMVAAVLVKDPELNSELHQKLRIKHLQQKVNINSRRQQSVLLEQQRLDSEQDKLMQKCKACNIPLLTQTQDEQNGFISEIIGHVRHIKAQNTESLI